MRLPEKGSSVAWSCSVDRISVHPAWRWASSSTFRTSAIFSVRTSLVIGGGRPSRAAKYASSGVDQEAAYECGSYGGPQVSEKAMLKSPDTIAALNSSLGSARRFTVIPTSARSARMSSSSTSRLASVSSTMKSRESSRQPGQLSSVAFSKS